MPEMSYGRSNRWLTVLTVDEKETGICATRIVQMLQEHNIESRPVWKPLHLQPLFAGAPFYAHHPNESVSEQLFRQGLCLPSGSNMSEEDQDRVIACIQACLDRQAGVQLEMPASKLRE